MKKKSVTLILILSMAICITACGSKADDMPKESQAVVESNVVENAETTKTSEAVTETAKPETVVETEPTGAVETPETTEEVTVAEPKLKVEIVEKLADETMGSDVVIASITDISDETYTFCPSGLMTGASDDMFEPGESTYVWGYPEAYEDKITSELEQCLLDVAGDTNIVTHMDTFTADQFTDAIALIESFYDDDNSEKRSYFVLYFNDDTLLGTTTEIGIDDATNELRLYYESANKLSILWCERTFN